MRQEVWSSSAWTVPLLGWWASLQYTIDGGLFADLGTMIRRCVSINMEIGGQRGRDSDDTRSLLW